MATGRGMGSIIIRHMICERGRDNMLRSLRQRSDELCFPCFIVSRLASSHGSARTGPSDQMKVIFHREITVPFQAAPRWKPRRTLQALKNPKLDCDWIREVIRAK
jgi:hypothetical protein